MSRHTTLRVGGPARYFFVGKSVEEVARAVAEARTKSVSYGIVGGGSNILLADRGFDGLIIKMGTRNISFVDQSHSSAYGTVVRAEAGVFSVALARAVAAQSLAGIEWMVTLPGTVGGAVYGNAGAFGSETKDCLASVEYLDQAGELQIMLRDACEFDYRNSIFKKQKPRLVVVAATFALKKGDASAIKTSMTTFLAKRKDEQPLGASSAGCMFKNHIEKDGTRVSAGYLIEKSGLKGFHVGAARVSDRHANFCLNTGGATAADVKTLAERVSDRVFSLHGIHLEPEVQFLGF